MLPSIYRHTLNKLRELALQSGASVDDGAFLTLRLAFLASANCRLSRDEANNDSSNGQFSDTHLVVPETASWAHIRKTASHSNDLPLALDTAFIDLRRANQLVLSGLWLGYFGSLHIQENYLSKMVEFLDKSNQDLAKTGTAKNLDNFFEYCLDAIRSSWNKASSTTFPIKGLGQLAANIQPPSAGIVVDYSAGIADVFSTINRPRSAHETANNNPQFFINEQNPALWEMAQLRLFLLGVGALELESKDRFHPSGRVDLAYSTNNCFPHTGSRNSEPLNAKIASQTIINITEDLSASGKAVIAAPVGFLWRKLKNEVNARKSIVDSALLDCVITLPGGRPFERSPSTCLLILSKKTKNPNTSNNPQAKQVLMIDGRHIIGASTSRKSELNQLQITTLTSIYRHWAMQTDDPDIESIKHIYTSVNREELVAHSYDLNPSRHIDESTP